MAETQVTIVNELGMHARPSAAFVELASSFSCDVKVAKDGGNLINGKSILGLMTLAAEQGSSLHIQCDGTDEAEALQSLVDLVEKGFDD